MILCPTFAATKLSRAKRFPEMAPKTQMPLGERARLRVKNLSIPLSST
ncbi:MAG: hypothetical protein K2P90_02930 [Holosporales bacterium]|nr:hypothetical protein [Holosporales bacterium]